MKHFDDAKVDLEARRNDATEEGDEDGSSGNNGW
jgi:hypothetical protein